jgi:hypothetical protein
MDAGTAVRVLWEHSKAGTSSLVTSCLPPTVQRDRAWEALGERAQGCYRLTDLGVKLLAPIRSAGPNVGHLARLWIFS